MFVVHVLIGTAFILIGMVGFLLGSPLAVLIGVLGMWINLFEVSYREERKTGLHPQFARDRLTA
jgi:hypothetical protein